MNEKEILEYNKRCAEFLGWKNLNDDSFPEYVNPLGDFYQLKELKFHSDWNFIMDVVEAIEKLQFNVRTSCTCITIENAFQNASNLKPIYKFHSMQVEGEFETKKEAVVQAINQFLIWYEQNNKV